MAAKKKRGRVPQAVLSLHLEATRERDSLLRKARHLEGAGKRREARVLLKTVEFLQAHLAALEGEGRPGSS